MKLTKRKLLVVAASVAVILLVVQVVTYVWRAERTMPVAGIAQIWVFAPAEGSVRSKFVCINKETWRGLTDSQRRTLEKKFKRNVPLVYHDVGDVPDEMKFFRKVTDEDKEQYELLKKEDWMTPKMLEEAREEIESGRRMVGLKRGSRINWELKRKGLFWMRCSSSRTAGRLAARGSEDVFIWVLGWWVRVYNVHYRIS